MDKRQARRRRRRRQQFQAGMMFLSCLLVMILGVYFLLGGYVGKKKDSIDIVPKEGKMTEIMQYDEDVTENSHVNENDTNEQLSEAMGIESEYQRALSLPAGELLATGMLSAELSKRFFYEADMGEVLPRIEGISYQENPNVSLSDLACLRMLYCGGDGNTYVGEMIVHQKIKEDVLTIFRELYENEYPIERMVLVDEYDGEDERSMEANNTSAFNYRTIAESSSLSSHSYGMAIDVNPKYNPYVKQTGDGSSICQPKSGRAYIDRTQEFPYKIDENDLAYRLFTQAGFTWGGSWNSVKDYQHFEKTE